MRRARATLARAATALGSFFAPIRAKINSTQASDGRQKAAPRSAPNPLRSRMPARWQATRTQQPIQQTHPIHPPPRIPRAHTGHERRPALHSSPDTQQQTIRSFQPQHAANSDHQRVCERLADLPAPPEGEIPPSGERALLGGDPARSSIRASHTEPTRAIPSHKKP